MALTKAQAITKVRKFVRDSKELNRLFENEYENTDNQIESAIEWCIMDYNVTGPILDTVTLETFPNDYLLCLGSICYLLQSAAVGQSRNRINYSDGGISVNISDKAQDYIGLANMFTNDYERKKIEFKRRQNLDSCWSY